VTGRSIASFRPALLASGGGLLVALSLPPWGFWPLALVGIAMFETALGEFPTRRQRLARGWLFGAAWLYLGMCWMWFLTIPGYLAAGAVFASLHALAALVSPTGPWRVIGRPAAHTLAEAIRLVVPFGGVPLATLPIGQAAGPFARIVSVGGVVLLTWVIFQIGFALAGPSPVVPALARKRGATAHGEWHGVIGASLAVLIWVISPLANNSVHATGVEMRVAAVQGGGEQGTHAVDTSAQVVLDRHLEATETIEPGTVDVVLWPENVVDVDDIRFTDSEALAEIAAEAKRLDVPFLVGITEDTLDDTGFLNAQVVVTPQGDVVSRYDKVRRVPFGEYMPLRGLLDAIGAPVDLVPRDAVAGDDPAVLVLPDGTKVSVVISWEIFFGDRVDEGVDAGGEFIVNPTNGSSYTWTVLQSQQVASSRLRAIEQDRWVVQAAPTGFSAFVSPDGDVYQRTSVSEQEVIVRAVELRSGRTWYGRFGGLPWALLAVATLVASQWFSRRGRESESVAPTP